MAGLLKRARAFFRRSQLDDDLREELEGHVELRRRQLIDEGMDPQTARLEAVRMFGNVTALRQSSRDVWSFPHLESLLQDVRFGARLLRQTPLFSTIAVLSLGSGIAAAVAVFNIADAVLFRPIPVRAPHELRAFRMEMRLGAASKQTDGVPEKAFLEIQRGADFADFIAFRTSSDVIAEPVGGAPRSTRVELVSPGYFEVLGVGVRLGRLLSRAEHDSGSPVAVITEHLWRLAFDADPGIVGRSLKLNGQVLTVVGVVRSFRGLAADLPADVFVSLRLTRAIDPMSVRINARLVARLRPGVTATEAEQKYTALHRAALPSIPRGAQLATTVIDASRGVSEARASLAEPLALGLVLAGVLVLVACANTGALLLSRFVSRREEFGVRVAIGAGRGRLARQLSIEALLVSLIAAGAGLLAGWLAAPLLMRLFPDAGSQVAFDVRFDGRLVVFTIGLAVMCAAAAVAASLFRLSRSNVATLISAESRSTVAGSRRATRALIAMQVACCLLLSVGAVSMARTLDNLRHVPLGFDLGQMFIVQVPANGLVEESAAGVFHGALHDRIAAVPGVRRATMAQVGILTTSGTTGTVDIDGFVPAAEDDRIARMFFIGPEYFETLAMPMLAGRAPTTLEVTRADRFAVVNERFAVFYFGSAEAAVGRLVNRELRIIGVVSDARYNTPREETPRAMFVGYLPMQRAHMVHIVRTAGDVPAVMAAVRDTVAAHDSRLRPTFATGQELLAAALARETFFATIAVALAALSITLACAGVYAAVAYAVSRRRAELAVRLALGASGGDVVRLVLRDPVVTTLAGAAAGIPGAYVVMGWLSSLLFAVPRFDWPTVFGCTAALLAFGLLAAAWPARRATRIDPVAALRSS